MDSFVFSIAYIALLFGIYKLHIIREDAAEKRYQNILYSLEKLSESIGSCASQIDVVLIEIEELKKQKLHQ